MGNTKKGTLRKQPTIKTMSRQSCGTINMATVAILGRPRYVAWIRDEETGVLALAALEVPTGTVTVSKVRYQQAAKLSYGGVDELKLSSRYKMVWDDINERLVVNLDGEAIVESAE